MSDTAEAVLQSTTRDIDMATGLFDAAQKRIPNRNYFSTDAGYAGAIAEYDPILHEAEQQAARAATATGKQLQGLLAQLGQDGPTLPAEDEPRAAQLRDLVKDEVTVLSWADLATALQQVALGKDTARQYLYWRYATLRLSTERAQPAQPSGSPQWSDSADEAHRARQDAEVHLRALATRLTPETITKLRARTIAVLTTAQKLQQQAEARKRSQETFRFQSAQDVAW